MSAADIARALGGAHRCGAWWRCRCPVHNSRGPTLAISDGERRLIVKCHAGCDPRDVLAELARRRLIPWRGTDRPLSPVARRPDNFAGADRRKLCLSRRVWEATQNTWETPVAAYLSSRGITIDPPPVLRYAAALRRPDGTSGPAMVARVDALDGELIGVHRTYLDRDPAGIWRRRDRASLGRIGGGAVRLAPAAETLMIGEGVETCLAAMQAAAQPAWAALSTSGLVALSLPPIVRAVVILADNDANGAGERAARAAAQRWLAAGRRVRIAIPPEPGTDMADVLAGCGYARITEARDAAA